MKDERPVITVDVLNCARCMGNHHCLEFREFSHRPIELGGEKATHWGICPSIGEPILLHVRQK